MGSNFTASSFQIVFVAKHQFHHPEQHLWPPIMTRTDRQPAAVDRSIARRPAQTDCICQRPFFLASDCFINRLQAQWNKGSIDCQRIYLKRHLFATCSPPFCLVCHALLPFFAVMVQPPIQSTDLGDTVLHRDETVEGNPQTARDYFRPFSSFLSPCSNRGCYTAAGLMWLWKT